MNQLRVLRGGLSATVQDLGRWHFQRFGVPVSGAMDAESHQLANLLVGNALGDATIEVAWHGSAFAFDQETLIALTGADLQALASGRRLPINRPILLPADTPVRFQYPRSGCYAYLAVAGGVNVPERLQSRSTYTRANLGGWQGRTLQNGDVLPLNPANEIAEAIAEVLRARDAASDGQRSHGPASQQPAVNAQLSVANWFVSADSTTQLGRTLELPTVRGRHFPFLRSSSQQIFWEAEFVVSQNSDRMGYRLEGPELGFVEPAHLSSAPVSRGTIQLPPHGSPIALLADAATTGGYPNIAHVASAELGRLAQAQPGQAIRFREIELAEAQDLLGEQSRRLRQWQRTIALRMSYASR